MKTSLNLHVRRITSSAILALAVTGPVASSRSGGLGDYLSVQTNSISLKPAWDRLRNKHTAAGTAATLVHPEPPAWTPTAIPMPGSTAASQPASQTATDPQAVTPAQAASPQATVPQATVSQAAAPQGVASAPTTTPQATATQPALLAQPAVMPQTVPTGTASAAGLAAPTPGAGVGAQYAFLPDGALLLSPPGESLYNFWYEHFLGKPPGNNREAWQFLEGILGQAAGTTAEALLQNGIGLERVKLANEFERRDYHDRMLPVYQGELGRVARFGAVKFVMYSNAGAYDFRTGTFPCDLRTVFYPWAEGQRFNLAQVEVQEPVARKFKGVNNSVGVVVIAHGRLVPSREARPEAVGRSIELLTAKVFLVAWQPLQRGGREVVEQMQLKEMTFNRDTVAGR